MKQYFRSRVSRMASYLEIALSGLIVLAVLLAGIEILVTLYGHFWDITHAIYTFDIQPFLKHVIELIIAVEFVKMISKHTPESTIEVLFFIIARKIAIDEPKYYEIVLGVVAICALLIVKRYFAQKTDPNGVIIEANTTLGEMNAILGTKFTPDDGGRSARDLVLHLIREEGLKPFTGLEVSYKQHRFKIYSMKELEIDAIEVIPLASKKEVKSFWRQMIGPASDSQSKN